MVFMCNVYLHTTLGDWSVLLTLLPYFSRAKSLSVRFIFNHTHMRRHWKRKLLFRKRSARARLDAFNKFSNQHLISAPVSFSLANEAKHLRSRCWPNDMDISQVVDRWKAAIKANINGNFLIFMCYFASALSLAEQLSFVSFAALHTETVESKEQN